MDRGVENQNFLKDVEESPEGALLEEICNEGDGNILEGLYAAVGDGYEIIACDTL